MGLTLNGSDEGCKSCAEGKARQKNIIVKASKRSDFMQHVQIHLDISSVQNKKQEILLQNHNGK
jgi:hypothetical protein